MISLVLECHENESEILSADLWEQGAVGIQEEPLLQGRCRLRAWFDSAGDLMQRFEAWSPAIADEPERDWEAETRQAWKPFAVGNRLWLAPAWDESAAPPGRVRLTIHPGLALGTGAHPATQLCLRALETHLRPGDRVLDVGTGTGILASAASLLGASSAVGCDMDADSVAVALVNAHADAAPLRLFTGSTRALRDGVADLLVANINAVTHQALAHEYARLTHRTLILSGYPVSDAAGVLDAFASAWRVVENLEEADWMCHVLRRQA